MGRNRQLLLFALMVGACLVWAATGWQVEAVRCRRALAAAEARTAQEHRARVEDQAHAAAAWQTLHDQTMAAVLADVHRTEGGACPPSPAPPAAPAAAPAPASGYTVLLEPGPAPGVTFYHALFRIQVAGPLAALAGRPLRPVAVFDGELTPATSLPAGVYRVWISPTGALDGMFDASNRRLP